jgi:hypothetical protein
VVDTDVHFFRAELVDAFRLTHKHDLEFLTVREIVDIFSQLLIHRIPLHRYIHSNPRLQINNIRFKRLDISFRFPQRF